MQRFRIQQSFIFTIFGASGDLAKIKLFPALYSLMEQGRLPEKFYIVGFSRTAKTEKDFRKEFIASIEDKIGKEVQKKILEDLAQKVHYFHGFYDHKADFEKYRSYLLKLVKAQKMTQIAYLSVPPQIFQPIIQNLGETKSSPHEDLRIVIEKPFGQDLVSAEKLFHFLARYFDEEHTYLLDHYLGKSAVQSILHLRHSNRFLNYMLKPAEIANIQITAFENIGVENRMSYFDQVGIVKDMVQSHLLQILALIAMSIPITEAAGSLHREKYNILSALNFPKSSKNIVLGQYENYTSESGKRKTETFAALRLFIDRESWYKIPIYIRTGKKLHKKHSYIVIEFKKFAFQPKAEEPNLLMIELHPEEKISIKLLNRNGFGASHYQSITTTNSLACHGDDCLPEHAMLFLDIIKKRKTHFLSFPEILASWKVTESMLECIGRNKVPVEIYKDFSKGPSSQKSLTLIDNFHWHDIH